MSLRNTLIAILVGSLPLISACNDDKKVNPAAASDGGNKAGGGDKKSEADLAKERALERAKLPPGAITGDFKVEGDAESVTSPIIAEVIEMFRDGKEIPADKLDEAFRSVFETELQNAGGDVDAAKADLDALVQTITGFEIEDVRGLMSGIELAVKRAKGHPQIWYNKTSKNIFDMFSNAEMQCFSGTSIFEYVRSRAIAPVDDEYPAIAYSDSHVLPVSMRWFEAEEGEPGEWGMLRHETTSVAQDTKFIPVSKIHEEWTGGPYRVIYPQDFKLAVILNTWLSEKEQKEFREKSLDRFAKAFGIDLPVVEAAIAEMPQHGGGLAILANSVYSFGDAYATIPDGRQSRAKSLPIESESAQAMFKVNETKTILDPEHANDPHYSEYSEEYRPTIDVYTGRLIDRQRTVPHSIFGLAREGNIQEVQSHLLSGVPANSYDGVGRIPQDETRVGANGKRASAPPSVDNPHFGTSLIQIAIDKGNMDLLNLLIEFNVRLDRMADPEWAGFRTMDPVEYARSKGQNTIADRIEQLRQ